MSGPRTAIATGSVLPRSPLLGGVLAKAVRDRWVPFVAITAVLWFYTAFALGVYSSFGNEAVNLVQQMPDALSALYGSNDGTVAGVVASATFAIMAPVVLVAYAIVSGKSAVLGEEKQRSLDLLLTSPVSRTRVLLSQLLVAGVAVVLISVLTWLGMEAVAAVVGMDLSGQDIAAATLQLCGLAWMFGALSAAICAWTGSGVGAGVAGAVAAISYFLTTLLPVSPELADYARYTPWYLYTGPEPLVGGVGWWQFLVLVAIAAALVLAALIGYRRRDLRG